MSGNGANTGKPIVVVVDDDAAVCNSLKFSLELEGFAVKTYANGSELLAAGELSAASCFVLDQKLPGMTGLEVLRQLRERRVAAPAILMTSHPTETVRRLAAMAGTPIIEKPLLGNALSESIRSACAAPKA